MKKIKKLVTLTAIILFISYSNDSYSQTYREMIVGTWNLTEFKSHGIVSTIITGKVTAKVNFSTFGKEFDAQLVYTEDRNKFLVAVSGSFVEVDIENDLDEDEEPEEEEVDLDEYMDEGSLIISENTMKLVSKIEETIEIVELSDSTLKLIKNLNISTTLAGIKTKTSSKQYLTFEKE